jgi:hypothetical protein
VKSYTLLDTLSEPAIGRFLSLHVGAAPLSASLPTDRGTVAGDAE